MAVLDYPAFDADNHYYEALDAFTRHVPKEMQPRCVQWAEINGRKHHLVGGKLARAVVNPTWNPIAKPGAISDFLRGNPNQKDPRELLAEREPLPDYYMNNDARVAKLDEQGLEAMWLFPTLGVLYEELLKHDTDAVVTLFRAFNRWLQEDWGCNYKGRIFGLAVHQPGGCGLCDRGTRMGSGAGCSHGRDASRCRRHAQRRAALALSCEVRSLLGASERGRHHGHHSRG